MKFDVLAGLAAVAAVGACAMSVPVNGELNGLAANGIATATFPVGTFQVQNTRGLICSGEYDAATIQITTTAEVTCNDGRKGKAIIARKTNLVEGTVIVRLSDGSEGRFVFGDLSFGDEFGT